MKEYLTVRLNNGDNYFPLPFQAMIGNISAVAQAVPGATGTVTVSHGANAAMVAGVVRSAAWTAANTAVTDEGLKDALEAVEWDTDEATTELAFGAVLTTYVNNGTLSAANRTTILTGITEAGTIVDPDGDASASLDAAAAAGVALIAANNQLAALAAVDILSPWKGVRNATYGRNTFSPTVPLKVTCASASNVGFIATIELNRTLTIPRAV